MSGYCVHAPCLKQGGQSCFAIIYDGRLTISFRYCKHKRSVVPSSYYRVIKETGLDISARLLGGRWFLLFYGELKNLLDVYSCEEGRSELAILYSTDWYHVLMRRDRGTAKHIQRRQVGS